MKEILNSETPQSSGNISIIPPGYSRHREEAAEAIRAAVACIPAGWVATYGQIAAMAGLPGRARLVGHVLRNTDPMAKIPWHRIVNAKGEVSCASSRQGQDAVQRRLLEQEGVVFDDKNRISLDRCRWPASLI
nr:MGMT family protein [Acetobacter fallax]